MGAYLHLQYSCWSTRWSWSKQEILMNDVVKDSRMYQCGVRLGFRGERRVTICSEVTRQFEQSLPLFSAHNEEFHLWPITSVKTNWKSRGQNDYTKVPAVRYWSIRLNTGWRKCTGLFRMAPEFWITCNRSVTMYVHALCSVRKPRKPLLS